MKYRIFGKTGEKVSVLGYGNMRLPVVNNDYGHVDVNAAMKLVRHAIDNGVNYLDTSWPYHNYTLTVPETQVRAAAFDTLSHLMEFYFCKPDTDNVSDDLLESLMRTQIRNFKATLVDYQDYDARSNIEWVSSLALCGIMGLGKQPDFDCHNLEHQIGAFTDCVHGEGLAVITPPYYRWLMPYAIDRFVRFAINVWRLPSEGSNEKLAKAGIDKLASFIAHAGLPTKMGQLGVKDETELLKIAQSVQTGPGSYHKCSQQDVINIFKSCW